MINDYEKLKEDEQAANKINQVSKKYVIINVCIAVVVAAAGANRLVMLIDDDDDDIETVTLNVLQRTFSRLMHILHTFPHAHTQFHCNMPYIIKPIVGSKADESESCFAVKHFHCKRVNSDVDLDNTTEKYVHLLKTIKQTKEERAIERERRKEVY